ncbi:hypothetical protein [Halospeciosus flavus]|uniref:Uncharacterized protein n=1 Tax=Halospeciosus flavus TaxID=3032283 RepID=A0ABD5Z9E5_9EURY|nr:hypothetical protein [Halospeciosus flavus]
MSGGSPAGGKSPEFLGRAAAAERSGERLAHLRQVTDLPTEVGDVLAEVGAGLSGVAGEHVHVVLQAPNTRLVGLAEGVQFSADVVDVLADGRGLVTDVRHLVPEGGDVLTEGGPSVACVVGRRPDRVEFVVDVVEACLRLGEEVRPVLVDDLLQHVGVRGEVLHPRLEVAESDRDALAG